MNDHSYIVGLDVGTTKVCTIIGQQSSRGLEVIGIGSHPSQGLKKGSVVNIDKTVRSIKCSFEEAKLMAGVDINHAVVGIAGNHIYSFNSTGVVPIKSEEIGQEDVDQVIEAAKAVLIPSDREILHVLPQEFKVDSTGGVKNPLGMHGVRLEANVHIVTGSVSLIRNLVKCVEQAGVKTKKIVLQPIASAHSVLSLEEKEMGVVLVDIGGGTTDIAIWNQGSLVHSQIIPVGGNHFTNDLAVALKISHDEAERVKINHGCVLTENLNQLAQIAVQGPPGTKEREVRISRIAEVLGARAEELFGILEKILKEKGLEASLTGGIVLTGGGSLINGLTDLCEYMLDRPTKIGFPKSLGGMTKVLEDPKFSTVLGLLLEQNKTEVEEDHHESSVRSHNFMEKIGDSLKSVFNEIF